MGKFGENIAPALIQAIAKVDREKMRDELDERGLSVSSIKISTYGPEARLIVFSRGGNAGTLSVFAEDADEIAERLMGVPSLEVKAVVNALQAVEWVHCEGGSYCPWCGERPHSPGCQRQNSLKPFELS